VLEAPACKSREQERTEGSEYQKSEDEFDDDDSRAVVAFDLADDEREIKRESVSVITVPPAAIPTARCRVTRCSWTTGYETRVCEAQRLP
jgi:hypothetical protein